ncbi:pentapeptide repeat-containing protein [Chondromyces apiculatus]|uniref:pentapeptide repeat-containing protein n=1 Tax=Chondromyces apiculatus TaxID=51 RepID=UPI001E36657F|nr:pentapeptide repeat-containing protein [Chondromyces apiculatus]
MKGAALSGAALTGAGLPGAALTGAALSGAALRGVGFSGAALTGAGSSGAALTGAWFLGGGATGTEPAGSKRSRPSTWRITWSLESGFSLPSHTARFGATACFNRKSRSASIVKQSASSSSARRPPVSITFPSSSATLDPGCEGNSVVLTIATLRTPASLRTFATCPASPPPRVLLLQTATSNRSMDCPPLRMSTSTPPSTACVTKLCPLSSSSEQASIPQPSRASISCSSSGRRPL